MDILGIDWQLKLLNAEKASRYSLGYGILVGIVDYKVESSQSAFIISSIAKGVKFVCCVEEDDHRITFDQGHYIYAIDMAVDKGCHVLCCSQAFRDLVYEKEWEDVIAKAYNNGLIVVAPTGNDNRRQVGFPAGLEGVISVGSSDELGQRFVWNRRCGSNYGAKIDCIAPGHSQPKGLFRNLGFIDAGVIASASMAGVVALLKSVKKSLSYHEIQDLISQYSSHSVIGWNPEIGFGVPDVFRMLANIAPSEVNTEKLIDKLRMIGLEIESIITELGGE